MNKLQSKTSYSTSKATTIALFVLTLLLFFLDQRWMKGYIIAWDIWSYYAYLPVTFLEQDFTMSFMDENPWMMRERYYPLKLDNGNWVIKTSMGMAIIYLPYFLIAHLWALIHTGMDANGFTQPYQIMIGLSGPVSMLIGLLALRKFMLRYFTESVVSLSFVFIILGTNALHYIYNEGAMSHIHNFMLYALFMRLTQLWHDSPTWKKSIQLALLSGFIALVRPNNALIGLFFIFYGVYDWNSFKNKITLVWKYKLHFIALPFIAISLWIPQFVYWKSITGHWLFNSYVGEGFYFDRPRFFLALFSYTKGWFVYTPIAVFGLAGLFLLGKERKEIRFLAPIFIALNLYVVFSWWCWWYGGGYSQRALIDSYPILALGFAALIHKIIKHKTIKGFFLVPMFLLLILSLFQTWQYKMTIIHWDSMSKELYWTVFLKTKHPKNYQDLLRTPNLEAAKKGEVRFWGDK